jgi:hypothetical protein
MKNYFINGKSMVLVMHGALFAIKYASWFPLDTANLRENATYLSPDGFSIVFDEQKAHYIPFLEFGTNPHFIPFAFGRNQIVYHPGSNKHLGFIRNKSSVTATEFIAKELNGKAVFYIND